MTTIWLQKSGRNGGFNVFLYKFPGRMKKIYIVAVVMIAVAIVLLTSTARDVSTYGTFADAQPF